MIYIYIHFSYFRISKQSYQTIEMSCFLDFPDELILKVLSYAETADILRCSRVSKRIRTISVDNSLFQTVNLSGKYVKSDLIRTVLDKGCKILNLSDSSTWGNLSLIQNSQLRELDLSNCRATFYYSTSGVLEELVKSCDSLQKLSLIGLKLTPKMVSSICKNSQTLQVLNLYYSSLEEEWYCKIIKTCKQIKQLVIEECTKMNLSQSGLLSITKRTEELMKRNEQTQKDKDLLREQTQDFFNKRLLCLINDQIYTT